MCWHCTLTNTFFVKIQVLRGFLRREKSGIDAVSAYCLDIVSALKRGDVQLPLPSQAAEEALSSYLVGENDVDDSSSVTSFRSFVSSTNSYATMTTATTNATREDNVDLYESRLQAFNSVSTMDTRSLFGHSVIPDDDDESMFSSRRSRRSTSSSSSTDEERCDDDDDDGVSKENKVTYDESRQKDAILKVQRWFRKNLKSMHHDHTDKEEETRKRKNSIVHIQRHFRGWRVRQAKKKKAPWRP